MKKVFLASLIVLLAIGVLFFVRLSGNDLASTQDSSEANSDDGILSGILDDKGGDRDEDETDDSGNSGILPSNGNSVQSSVLAQHNKQSDCWVAYDGKVYDITSYLPKHPGSAGKIAPYCGTSDGFINAFEGKHGTSKVSLLMKVGVLMGDLEIVGNA